jgi:hypothetical protein
VTTPDQQHLADMLALAEQQRSRTAALLRPDAALIYGSWGLAWLIGPGLLWLAMVQGTVPLPVAGAVYGGLLLAAGVVTGVHAGRRSAGVIGPSRRIGAMYGWSWFLGFGALVAIMIAIEGAGASETVLRVLWPALSCLVVGLLYLISGALWQDVVQYATGVWVLVVGAAGALVGTPGNLLVLSLTGGGAFLVAAAAARIRFRA